MAISSAIITSNSNVSYEMEVTETAISVANNTSTVNVKVYAWSTKSGFTIDYDGECYLKIDGVQKTTNSWARTQKPIVYGYANKVTLYDANFTITHNIDGSKSIQVASCFELYSDGYVKLTSSFKSFNIVLTSFDVAASRLAVVDTLSIDSSSSKLKFHAKVYDTAYTHTLTISDGSTTILTISNLTLSDGYNEYTLSSSDKSTISSYLSLAGITSLVCTYTLMTYAGNNVVGSSTSCKGTIRTLLTGGTPLVEFRSGSVKVNGSFEQTTPNMEVRDGHILKQLRW